MARRTDSYNQGLVVSARPLARNTLFSVTVSHTAQRWSAGLAAGLLAGPGPVATTLPVSLLHCRRDCWAVAGDGRYIDGVSKMICCTTFAGLGIRCGCRGCTGRDWTGCSPATL